MLRVAARVEVGRCRMLTYADVCRMLTYADVCCRKQVKTGEAAGGGAGGSRCGKDGKRVKMTMPVLRLLPLLVQKCKD